MAKKKTSKSRELPASNGHVTDINLMTTNPIDYVTITIPVVRSLSETEIGNWWKYRDFGIRFRESERNLMDAFQQIKCGLELSPDGFVAGQKVSGKTDVIRWLLNQVVVSSTLDTLDEGT